MSSTIEIPKKVPNSRRKILTVVAVLFIISLLVSLSYQLIINMNVPSHGGIIVRGAFVVLLYQDDKTTLIDPPEIDWGTVEPGTNYYKKFWLYCNDAKT